ATVLTAPLEERGLADAVFPQQISDGDATLGVLEDLDDLGFVELRLPHDRSLPGAVYLGTVNRSGELTLATNGGGVPTGITPRFDARRGPPRRVGKRTPHRPASVRSDIGTGP